MIVLINPNSTRSMTDAMLRTAQQTAPWAEFQGWTSDHGPAAIEGPQAGAAATPPLLELVQKASDDGARTILIGCFDDTGLDEARALAACPVIGIGQAAYHMAAMTAGRFSVVTTLAVSVPVLEANIAAYGLGAQVARVRASDVPVLALEHDPQAASRRVIAEILAAEREDAIQAVVLGCGGMASLVESAADHTRIRLIDGVRAAAHIASAL